MYYPYLRGRQYELLAIRELLQHKLIDTKCVVPVIEPVKLNAILINSLKKIEDNAGALVLIQNPKVGSVNRDIMQQKNQDIAREYMCLLGSDSFVKAYIVDDNKDVDLCKAEDHSYFVIINNKDGLEAFETLDNPQKVKGVFASDERIYRRRLLENRVLLNDYFDKKDRNVDYIEIPDQAFSEDHLYYEEDGFIAFSDYSVIGKQYSESGFAPYAVAIHMVYFDKNKSLRIKHFVSDSNYDINDPAKKFREALNKLINWKNENKLTSYALEQFQYMYDNDIYPGLGIVKKLSVMHHLELINNYIKGSRQ